MIVECPRQDSSGWGLELVPFLFVADSNFDPARSCFLSLVHRVSRLVFVFKESFVISVLYRGFQVGVEVGTLSGHRVIMFRSRLSLVAPSS